MSATSAVKGDPHSQQIARLEAEVVALRQQLRHSHRLATVGTMAAMVAHEFNNILTPVVNYAILARSNPSLVEKAIAAAEKGGRQATDICRSLLSMTGPEADSPEPVELLSLVDETVAMMARSPAKDGIDLTIDIPASMTLTCRRVELQQVVLNLLMNARTALLRRPAPRSIHITAAQAGDAASLTVQDNGPGIDPENIDRIFDPFFSTCQDDDNSGHGLGLAICHEIIAAAEGSIEVESCPGGGTTFTVVLPV